MSADGEGSGGILRGNGWEVEGEIVGVTDAGGIWGSKGDDGEGWWL